MARIVIDARQYTTSTGRYTFRLVEHLEKIDAENDYIVLLQPEDMHAYEFTNRRFAKLPCPHKEFTFAEQLALNKQIRDLKPDLVHFTMTQQPVLYRGKTVSTMHDLTTVRFRNPSKNAVVFKIKQWVYRWVNRRVARKSQAVITPSQYVKDDIVNFAHIDPARVTVTYEAADPINEAAQPIETLKNKQFIMYLGRPTPHKNLERLIDAFVTLRASHPDLYLVLAGKKDANYDRIEQLVTAKGIKNVYFTGFISDGQLRWLYEHCAAYIFPSLSEGFGLPGLEAMAQGAPVVSSNATCLPEVYDDAAHYFDPLDVQNIADVINEVLTNKDLRQELVTKGKKQAEKYSWQRTAEQTLAIYNHVLSSK